MTMYIYDLKSLMNQLGVETLSEVKSRGYDVEEYLERRSRELEAESAWLGEMKEQLQTCEGRSPSRDDAGDWDDEPYVGSWDVCSEDYIGT